MEETKSIKIGKKTHKLVDMYCTWKDISIKQFIENLIEKNDEIQKFNQKIDNMKFGGG